MSDQLRPVAAVQCSILNSLTQVFCQNFRRCFKIGYRSRYLQNSVVGSGGKSKLRHSVFQQFLCFNTRSSGNLGF
jgi:hypothetical protein